MLRVQSLVDEEGSVDHSAVVSDKADHSSRPTDQLNSTCQFNVRDPGPRTFNFNLGQYLRRHEMQDIIEIIYINSILL